MSNYIDTVITKSKDYIELCTEKIEYHSTNSKNCNNWNKFINIGNMVLSALLSFSTTIMTVLQASSTTVTIVASCFSLFIIIGNSLKDSYSFKSLGFKHDCAVDSYESLKQSFNNLLNEIEKHNFKETDYEELATRYSAVCAKSHYTSCECVLSCCCGINGR